MGSASVPSILNVAFVAIKLHGLLGLRVLHRAGLRRERWSLAQLRNNLGIIVVVVIPFSFLLFFLVGNEASQVDSRPVQHIAFVVVVALLAALILVLRRGLVSVATSITRR